MRISRNIIKYMLKYTGYLEPFSAIRSHAILLVYMNLICLIYVRIAQQGGTPYLSRNIMHDSVKSLK